MTYLARLSANVELVPVAASPGAAVRCPSPGQRGPLSPCSRFGRPCEAQQGGPALACVPHPSAGRGHRAEGPQSSARQAGRGRCVLRCPRPPGRSARVPSAAGGRARGPRLPLPPAGAGNPGSSRSLCLRATRPPRLTSVAPASALSPRATSAATWTETGAWGPSARTRLRHRRRVTRPGPLLRGGSPRRDVRPPPHGAHASAVPDPPRRPDGPGGGGSGGESEGGSGGSVCAHRGSLRAYPAGAPRARRP